MNDRETVLKVLLKQQHLQEHAAFRRAYDRAAATVDRKLVGGAPSKATFYRWLGGDLSNLPHPRHCQVLEALVPGWTACELFEQWREGVPTKPELRPEVPTQRVAGELPQLAERHKRYADLSAVFTSRAEFTHEMPPTALFDYASDIRACGLSLNMICQHYGDRALKERIEHGECTVSLLFLEPYGAETTARESEEGYKAGYLSSLTELNLHCVKRLRDSMAEPARDRLTIRTYDETIRFNITLVNDRTCVIQPYLPNARGLDSPAFVADKDGTGQPGLYDIFEDVFASLWNRGTPR
jgi:hypothetical protein